MSTRIESIREAGPGLGITFTIAIIAYLTSSMHPSFDALIISIIFGMLVANMLDDKSIIQEGINMALKIFLPLGIALYGLQLRIATVEARLLPGSLIVFAATFVVCYFISRGMGLGRPLSVLLSTGMSVCGASAIVVVASVLGTKKEDTSIALLSVIAVGLTGMIIYRILPEMVGMDSGSFAFFSGTTLPMIGQVKVASSVLGKDVMAAALDYKLVRISALALVAGIAILFSREKGKGFHMPWFMAAFFVLAIAVNFVGFVEELSHAVQPIGKLFLSIALAAVGLSIDFESVAEKGWGPLVAVFITWAIIVLTVYLALNVIV